MEKGRVLLVEGGEARRLIQRFRGLHFFCWLLRVMIYLSFNVIHYKRGTIVEGG